MGQLSQVPEFTQMNTQAEEATAVEGEEVCFLFLVLRSWFFVP